MAEQFEVTQQEKEYRPTQATDFVREFDAHIAERDAMNKPYEASLIARSEQMVTDANKQVREMEQLAKLSNSLMDKLVDMQKKANEEQYAQGLADALMDGPDLVGQQELEQEESALVAGQKVATDTSQKYLAEGGTESNAREIRNTGGWYGYGRFVGQLQMLGDNYGMALEEAKGSFTISIDGRELGYEQLTTKDEYNTWQRAFNKEYLKGVPRTNGDVVEKYTLRTMRAQANADRAQWIKEYNENRLAEEKEERQTAFIADIRRGDTGIAERYFATAPGSFREKRDEMEANLLLAIDTNQMTPDQALNFYETQTIVKDGKRQTMAEAFPLQYELFSDEVAKARTKEDNEYVANLTSDARELQRELANGPPLNDQQIAALQTSPRYRNNHAAQQILQNHITREESEDIGSRAYLDDLYRSGDLTPDVLQRFNHEIQQEYASKANETASIAGEYDSKIGDQDAHGAAIVALDYQRGEVPNQNDPDYRRVFRRAQGVHKSAYAEARRAGKTHEEAMTYAKQQVERVVEKNPLSLTEKEAPITLTGKVAAARKFAKNNGQGFNAKIPNSQTQLNEAVEYLRTGRGTMPGFYSALAAGHPYSAEDLVLKQAELHGIDVQDIKERATPYKQGKVKLRPELQRLMTVAPNRQTYAQATTRAVLGGDDTKFFLDQVASVESTSMGGYDAYNLGGSNGGHTAHGSGNSAKDGRFGKPVSQLTIGEIKRLHAAGQAHAMGRYQFIASTFAEVAPLTGLPDSQVFDAKTQDLFAITRLIQRASWGNLRTGLRSEWIGLNYIKGPTYERVLQAARAIVAENK